MTRKIVAGTIVAAAVALAAGCQTSPPPPEARTVKLEVTDAGFVPAEVQVRSGQPVVLLVTRKTEATCAKEIVIEDANVRQDLPLNQEVRVAFTTEKKGTLKYACGMDMITGSLGVQ